jgi:hypothetical protein
MRLGRLIFSAVPAMSPRFWLVAVAATQPLLVLQRWDASKRSLESTDMAEHTRPSLRKRRSRSVRERARDLVISATTIESARSRTMQHSSRAD